MRLEYQKHIDDFKTFVQSEINRLKKTENNIYYSKNGTTEKIELFQEFLNEINVIEEKANTHYKSNKSNNNDRETRDFAIKNLHSAGLRAEEKHNNTRHRGLIERLIGKILAGKIPFLKSGVENGLGGFQYFLGSQSRMNLVRHNFFYENRYRHLELFNERDEYTVKKTSTEETKIKNIK